jgi:hypothetical protein
MLKKSHTLEELLSDIEEIKKKKLLSEIKWLKTQRTIALLGVIGAVLAFSITNIASLERLFYNKPMFNIEVDNEYLLKHGELIVYNNYDSIEPRQVIRTKLNEASDYTSIAEGSYTFVIRNKNINLLSEQLLLKEGDVKTIILPSLNRNIININVTNLTPKPLPEQPLEFSIETSGNGYLWVFEHVDKQYALLYPARGNIVEIRAMSEFKLVPSDKEGLFAGSTIGEEKLLFVVTSNGDSNVAQRIANNLSDSIITKASAGKLKENWGATEISYKVGGG